MVAGAHRSTPGDPVSDGLAESTAPTPVAAVLKGLCPRCGATGLFRGWLDFADRCAVCGLDYSAFNVGDGPAAILTLVLGGLIVGIAITIQLRLDPPIWLQLIVWLPITVISVVGSLRIAKAALLGSEFRTAAHEGRLAPPETEHRP
ncbi:DUF983 domain-containing protein [Sphingomonas sp. MMS24-J45]|uniref:DUF983 domain-containing protein n=1 Tax=Sphingomonas sp. MMS24-J45 TaxID=3238806 RepID=UPI00384E7C5A